MKLSNLRVCNLTQPIGYAMDAPVFSWTVEGSESAQSRARLTIRAGGETVYDSGAVQDADSLGWRIELALRPRTRYDYTLSVCALDGEEASAQSFFETGKRDEPWTARWISPGTRKSGALLEKKFSTASLTGGERLYICGLGVYEATLNGEKIGGEYLAPGYHSYDFHLSAQTYDVSDLLKTGENCLVIALGEGWFKGRLGFDGGYTDLYGDRLYAIAELRQGDTLLCATDGSWEERRSPVTFANIYDGETCDARIAPDYIGQAELCAPDGCGALQDRVSLPVEELDRFPVKELIKTPKGDTVLDFGQNLTGWVRFRCSLPAGTGISLTAGEILQDEHRPLWVSADECLRQAVVDIAHPTVFSLPDGTDAPSGGGGLPGLEFPAELLVMRPFLFHNSPGCKGSPLSIKRCGEESDAPVNTHYNCIRSQRNRVLHFGSHRDMQVELPVTADQFRGAKDNAICECPFECIGAERDPDPSGKRIDAEEPAGTGPVPHDGIIPVPDEAGLGFPELRHGNAEAFFR